MNAIQQDRARKVLLKKYGYDIVKARRFILAKAKLRKESMLEVGTGRGHMAIALAEEGFTVVSIDLDKKAQAVAKANLAARKLSGAVRLMIMDAERLQFKDKSFNTVVSVNFLHHAKNPVLCVREMVRVAQAKLVIADLNKKGERIMERVHRLDGHAHDHSRMPISAVKLLLEELGLGVKTYRDSCQTVLVAQKGGVK